MTEVGAGDPQTAGAIRSSVYDDMVQHEADLVGMIAYALYKSSKKEWLAAGAAEAARPHYHTMMIPTHISVFRARAQRMMSEFAESVVEDAADGIAAEALQSAAIQEIRTHTSFWRTAVAGAVGSFLFALVMVVATFIWFVPSLKDILKTVSAG